MADSDCAPPTTPIMPASHKINRKVRCFNSQHSIHTTVWPPSSHIMFTTIVLGLLLSHVSGKAGVAADRNLTALNTQIAPSWVPDPDNRGTWSLLYSCVFTLVLCVWTAIHPNIPAQGESQARQFCRKMGWVLAAILAPEFGAFTAWQQWCWSRRLCSELNTYRSAKGGKILRDVSAYRLQTLSMK